MKKILTTLVCLIAGVAACSSNDNAIVSDSPDASEVVSQTSQSLQAFPSWTLLQESGGCVSKGTTNTGVPTLFGDEACTQSVTNFFQVSGTGQVKTWDQYCLDGTIVSGSALTNIVVCGTTPNENWNYSNRELINNTGCLKCDTFCVEATCTAAPRDELFTEVVNPPPYRSNTIAAYYPANPNLCLEPTRGLNTFAGDTVMSTTCDGSGFDQLWANDGGFIIWATSGFCLTASANDAAPVTLQNCNGSSFQQWTTMAPNALYNIGSARCLDIPAHALGTTTVQTYDCNGGLNQQFNGPHS